ncbi:MAG: hypothetical protein AMXMBFR47_36860 [Planctomycetota bacterium]
MFLMRCCLIAALLHLCSIAPAGEKLFAYRETTLENGLRVVTLEDFSCPIVAVHLWYHVGSKDENPERQGFAHMFEHMMFRGTDRLGPTDHFDLIRKSGGDCNAYTAFDQTVYVQTLPANQLELALWLEAERMTFLKIDQTAFDTERKVVEEERRLGLNRPYGTVPEKLLPQMLKVHPYRWLPIGNIAHLRAASVGELRDFWTKFYVPNNATLVIVGAVKHEDAQKLVQKYFGWIPRYDAPSRVTVTEPAIEQPFRTTIKAENAPAPIVAVAFRTVPAGHDDLIPLQMLGSILGGGESSRLYRRLVANEQTAMVAGAAAFSLEQDGLIGAGAVLSPLGGDPEKVLAAINEEIERIRKEPVTGDELLKARNEMLNGLITQNLTVESKAQALGEAAVVQGDLSRVNREMELIRKISADDLLTVANRYLDPNRSYTVTVERNLLGTLLGGKKSAEESAQITATPETEPPPPGRQGLERPTGFPTTAPVAGPIDFKVTPEFETETLENGLKIIVVRNSEVPYVTVQLGLRAGAWTESKPGVASMAMNLLTKGTQNYTDEKLATELDTYAISLGASANLDASNIVLGCLTDQLERGMTLMAEVVRRPTFPEEEFEKSRKQVLTQLTISAAEHGYVADRELRRRLYGEHPYARTAVGEPSDVEALEPGDFAAWYRRFIRPDSGTLIFAGDIDKATAVALAGKHFGDWKAEGDEPPTVQLPEIPEPAGTHIYLVDKPGVQCQIRAAHIGFTRSAPEYYTSRVVSSYFGGAFNSRLNETIRVKKGLTYGASGGWSASRFAGQFSIRTFSKLETTAQAVQAIFDELGRLKSEPPTDEELGGTKSYILGSFAGDRETPQAVAGDLWMLELEKLPRDYFEKLLKTVSATTRDQCVELASLAVQPDKMVVVVVGPAAQVKADLEKIAPVTVVTPGDRPADEEPVEEE